MKIKRRTVWVFASAWLCFAVAVLVQILIEGGTL